MVMASSLTRPDKRSNLSPKEEKWQEACADALIAGHTAASIAKKLAKGDDVKYHRIYNKVRRLAQSDARFQARVMARAKGESIMRLGPQVKAIGRRAERGRVDAAKLLWSMNGFHNEKVDHRHSGEIQISVSIPRPKTTVDQLGPGKDTESYVDADVVEE